MSSYYVYFARTIAANGMDMQAIKIGYSSDPERRVNAVNVQLPFHCELITTVPGELFVEKAVHLWHRHEKIRGEFFHARGELLDTIEYVKTNGRLPFPLSEEPGPYNFTTLNLPAFMSRRGITFSDIKKHTGIQPAYYRDLLAKDPTGNRSVMAALSVTAIRMGQAVCWPRDFSFDYVKEAA